MIKTYRCLSASVSVSPLFLAMFTAAAPAATLVDLHGHDVQSRNSAYTAVARSVGAALKPSERHAEWLGLDAESSLTPINVIDEADGTHHYRYQQTFRGIPVWGEHIVVSEGTNGQVRQLFGRQIGDLAADLGSMQTKLDAKGALDIAKAATFGLTRQIRYEREDSNLMIVVDDAGYAQLGYVVSFFADRINGGAPTRPFVIVDAQTGKVLKQWDGLTTPSIGTGPGGNVKTGQYEWGSGGALRLPRRHPERHHLHDEQHQREDGEPQRRHQWHHRVLLHLPAQHREDDQRRLLAAERRALLRRRDPEHVPGLHGLQRADVPAGDAHALQHAATRTRSGTAPR